MKAGLSVILCVGETLEQREANDTLSVVHRQLSGALPYISDWSKIVIAYEPVWAIGTGKVATPTQAQEVHEEIRKWLNKNVSAQVADVIQVIYGGNIYFKKVRICKWRKLQ